MAVVYLAIASSPCPQPRPDGFAINGLTTGLAVGHVHGDAAPQGASTSITALCLCGCEHGSTSSGVAKRVEAVLPSEPAPPLGRAQSQPRELAQRLPDTPISVASPVPIAT